MESYAIIDLAASAPNHVVLRQIEPDRMRAEMVAFIAIIENTAPMWNRKTDEHPMALVGRYVLPVPLSFLKAGFDPGEVAHAFADIYWEVRVADNDAIIARLEDTFSCGPSCRWRPEVYVPDDGSVVDFVLVHAADCEEASDD